MSAAPLPVLLAEGSRVALRWHAMPAAWVFFMLVLPAAALVAWWAYRRDRDLPTGARVLLASLRAAALLFVALVLFGPYVERAEKRSVRPHLLVLVDTSASMATVDGYDADDARELAAASGLSVDDVGRANRLDLAKAVIANASPGLLERLAEDFRVHVYGFGSQLVPLVSTGDTADDESGGDPTPPGERIRRRLPELRPVDPSTRLGQAVSLALDAYRLRDEPVAGIVVVSDGQQNGGSVTPLEAGRRAGELHVPVYAVGVGDPKSPRNVHVSNLRAKEVVLARDTAVFEFDVRAKGFERRTVGIDVLPLDDEGAKAGPPLAVNPGELVLKGGDDVQEVKFAYRFERAGTYRLRVGIAVQPEEKIKSDNYVLQTVRVIDRKLKVLYVEANPRWEYHYLSNALCRDRETMLAHCLLLEADPETPQRKTNAPDWPPLDPSRTLPERQKLFDYDVIILGDVNWELFGVNDEQRREAVANLWEFVEKGGGLIVIAGPRNNPSLWKDTHLAAALPIVVDRDAEYQDQLHSHDTAHGFPLELTQEALDSPFMNIAGDPDDSRRLWETSPSFRQFWSYPALRAKALAKVLAVSGDPGDDNRYGKRPVIATMPYGRGRTLFIGVEELWRTRYEVADRYFYRFYGEAIRFLATYKLLSGNKRFKILTDLDTYSLDDPVRITVDVLDGDYEPARAETQTVHLDMPGPDPSDPKRRERVDLVIPLDPTEKGTYRKTIVPTRPGDYTLTATMTDDPKDEQPEKVFHVVQSSLEGRDVLLNESALRDLAGAHGGEYLYLKDLPNLAPSTRDVEVATDVHEDEIWDNAWTLAIAVALLGAEWALRKRWRLV